eukprot:6461213-Amphidinium_carterae.1
MRTACRRELIDYTTHHCERQKYGGPQVVHELGKVRKLRGQAEGRWLISAIVRKSRCQAN